VDDYHYLGIKQTDGDEALFAVFKAVIRKVKVGPENITRESAKS